MIPTPLSALDEKRFGIRSARGVITGQENISAVLGFCREQGVKLLIARRDTREIATAQELERQGFLLMDTLVYYRRTLENLPCFQMISSLAIPLLKMRRRSRRSRRGPFGVTRTIIILTLVWIQPSVTRYMLTGRCVRAVKKVQMRSSWLKRRIKSWGS